MKKVKNPYQIFDSYCLRTPLFSFSAYQKIISKQKLEKKDFSQILENSIFREALFLASPTLISQIKKWEKGLITDAKKEKRILNSILKYYTRISTRCTPFGLFASCLIGKFEDQTSIQLTKIDDYQRITRFDTVFLTSLFHWLIKNESIKNQLLFYPNNTLYKVGDHYRYVEYTIQNEHREYSLEGIVSSEELEKVLNAAVSGKTIQQLAKTIQNEDIAFNEASEFIEDLIEYQILTSELEITLTGDDYLSRLIDKVSKIDQTGQEYTSLKKLQLSIQELDESFGNSDNTYNNLISKINFVSPGINTKYLFQTDCFSNAYVNTLNSKNRRRIYKAIEAFNKMTISPSNSRLKDFKRLFSERFEQQEVPLVYALDIETGIGYGDKNKGNSPFLENILSPNPKRKYQNIVWSKTDALLQGKLIKCFSEKNYVLSINERDLSDFDENWDDLPDTFSAMIELYKRDEGEVICIKGAGGSSAVNLLGRFSHGKNLISDHVDEIVSLENQMEPDIIFAEIIHLPEARTGNVLQRKALRSYEIPYLSESSNKAEFQIPISDLMISVKNNNIILSSKKLNKRIIPRLGNAHNYENNSLPVYQFLCELQTQNKRSVIGFHWNSIFLELPFLPRVVYEGIIFSKARWNIDVAAFIKRFEDGKTLKEIISFQKDNQIPDYVELVDYDNRLFVNFKNLTSFNMLYDIVKNRKRFLLEEFLFTTDEIVTRDSRSFCNQFIVSFYNQKKLQSEK